MRCDRRRNGQKHQTLDAVVLLNLFWYESVVEIWQQWTWLLFRSFCLVEAGAASTGTLNVLDVFDGNDRYHCLV